MSADSTESVSSQFGNASVARALALMTWIVMLTCVVVPQSWRMNQVVADLMAGAFAIGLAYKTPAYVMGNISPSDVLNRYIARCCIGLATWAFRSFLLGEIELGLSLAAFALAVPAFFDIREVLEDVRTVLGRIESAGNLRLDLERDNLLERCCLQVTHLRSTVDTRWTPEVIHWNLQNFAAQSVTADHWCDEAGNWSTDIVKVNLSPVRKQDVLAVIMIINEVRAAMRDCDFNDLGAHSTWTKLRHRASFATTVASNITRDPQGAIPLSEIPTVELAHEQAGTSDSAPNSDTEEEVS